MRRHGCLKREDAMRMISKKARPRRMAYLGMALFLFALPACHGAGPWYRNQADGSSNTVYRPTYPAPGQRAFYASGYGGADYSPARPRKRSDCPVPPVAAPAAVENPPTVTVNQGSWDTE